MALINNKTHNELACHGVILMQLLFNNSQYINEAEEVSLTVIFIHTWTLIIKCIQ